MTASSTQNAGRLLTIGDIHGCHLALETLLIELEPAAQDTVIVLGDVIDRGPGTRQCIDLLIQLQSRCQLICIMGNHEEMFLDAMNGGRWLRTWQQNGGYEMLDSYGGNPDNIPAAHYEFIQSMREYHETEWDIFSHATPQFDLIMPEQSGQGLRWNRITGREPIHCSGKRVICGHTSQRGGVPLVFRGYACIDTNAYGSGTLTALDVLEDVVYQADQSGHFQGGIPLKAYELRY